MSSSVYNSIKINFLYYRAHFKPGYIFLTGLMMCSLIYGNYYTSFLFIEKTNLLQSFAKYYGLYFIPFITAYLLQYFFYNNTFFIRSRWFWIFVLLAPAIFALRVNIKFNSLLFLQEPYFLLIAGRLLKILLLMAGSALLWHCKEEKKEIVRVLKKPNSLKPYFILLALMLPLIVIASNSHAFLQQYPLALKTTGLNFSDHPLWVMLYELVYALDFLSIEFFFRGFLVIAFTRIAGSQAIIPAACFYCCIHFGKPMAEAISSFFGGVLLGGISYSTRSIWGGLLIHIGIALFMELFAMLHSV